MIQRVFNVLSARIMGLHQAAYILGGFALVSSILAFMRDRLLAHTFGAGLELDIYYAAFRIPDVIFVIVASMVSVYALIPILSKMSEDEQYKYIDTIFVGFTLLAFVVSVIAFIFTPQFLLLFFPKLAEQGFLQELVLLSRVMLFQPILFGVSNILAAVTQIRGRYILYATTSLLYNIGIIIGVLVLYPHFGLLGLAMGVVLGAFMHVGVQLPSIFKDGFLIRLPRIHNIAILKKTFLISLPRAMALSINQIVLFVFFIFAGGMTAGSIAVFSLAFNLQSVPLAIIGASYSVAAFPTLASAFLNGNHSKFVFHVVSAARHVFFWSLPAVALIIVLRAHIVRVVLGTGKFDWTDTRLTAAALSMFAISLVAHALLLLLIRAYYASGKSWVPVWVSVGSATFTILLGFVFVNSAPGFGGRMFVEALLRVVDVPGSEILLLPFAYSIGSIVGVILILILFERHFGGFFAGVKMVVWQSLVASGIAAFVAYGVLLLLGGVKESATFWSVLIDGSVAGTLGLMSAGIFYWFSGNIELREVISAISRRWGVHPVYSNENEV